MHLTEGSPGNFIQSFYEGHLGLNIAILYLSSDPKDYDFLNRVSEFDRHLGQHVGMFLFSPASHDLKGMQEKVKLPLFSIDSPDTGNANLAFLFAKALHDGSNNLSAGGVSVDTVSDRIASRLKEVMHNPSHTQSAEAYIDAIKRYQAIIVNDFVSYFKIEEEELPAIVVLIRGNKDALIISEMTRNDAEQLIRSTSAFSKLANQEDLFNTNDHIEKKIYSLVWDERKKERQMTKFFAHVRDVDAFAGTGYEQIIKNWYYEKHKAFNWGDLLELNREHFQLYRTRLRPLLRAATSSDGYLYPANQNQLAKDLEKILEQQLEQQRNFEVLADLHFNKFKTRHEQTLFVRKLNLKLSEMLSIVNAGRRIIDFF